MTGMSVAQEAAVRARLLVVDDDEGVLNFLRRVLTSEGFEVTLATSVSDARAAIKTDLPELVVLDLGLADDDGLELLAELRTDTDIPVIVLTGRGAEHDRVLGLRMGADDYIVKPFSAGELVARIRAIQRRGRAPSARRAPIAVGSITLDPASRAVTKDGEPIELAAKEFDLLKFLMSHAGEVVGREEIMDEVWDPHWFGPTKTLDVHISWLRKKIEDEPSAPTYITTVRGVGFRFAAPER
jgi:DNA-binding response OmpR family regulator